MQSTCFSAAITPSLSIYNRAISRAKRSFTTLLAISATVLMIPASANPGSYNFSPVTAKQVNHAVSQLDRIAEEMMSRSGLPGMAIAVVYNDRLLYSKGFGIRQIGSPYRIDADTVFQIASVSKSIGATAIAKAVSNGTVSWDDPVVRYLPDFQLSDPYVTKQVTIADLYSHRSGLPDHAADELEDLGFSREEMFARLRFLPLDPFRISYHYTNFGMTAAGIAVAKASGQNWNEFSRTHLYAPLGMMSTSSSYADFMSRDNKALGNIRLEDGTWIATPNQRQPDAQSPAEESVRQSTTWLNGCAWYSQVANSKGNPLLTQMFYVKS